MMERKPGTVVIRSIDMEKTLKIEVNDWWWEDNLLVLRTKKGTRVYYNRKEISYCVVPDMKEI